MPPMMQKEKPSSMSFDKLRMTSSETETGLKDLSAAVEMTGLVMPPMMQKEKPS